MPCYHPITALQPSAGGPLLFPQEEHLYLYNDYRTLQIPCGQCSGCRLKRSREWAIRCLHEKQMHKHSSFVTLTYNNNTLPEHGSLRYRDFQLFMKKLRRLAGREWARRRADAAHAENRFNIAAAAATLGPDINQNRLPSLLVDASVDKPQTRFYMAGEYGETYGRPHYHALIFGLDFNDKKYLRKTPSGERIYTSATLEKTWQLGFSSVGELTYKSAAYVARYIMTKRTGDGEKTDYKILDLDTGEIISKKKEFNTMSRRPGIGSSWLRKYSSDVYTSGKVVANGHQHNPPRYYDKLYKKLDQAQLEDFQYARYTEALAQQEHHTPERLAVQEQVQAAKTRTLKRSIQ